MRSEADEITEPTFREAAASGLTSLNSPFALDLWNMSSRDVDRSSFLLKRLVLEVNETDAQIRLDSLLKFIREKFEIQQFVMDAFMIRSRQFFDEEFVRKRYGRCCDVRMAAPVQMQYRAALVSVAAMFVHSLNERATKAKFGLNYLAFLDPAEKKTYKGYVHPAKGTVNVTRITDANVTTTRRRLATAPASFDWRSENKVNQVLNQANCGDCYAFSAAGALASSLAAAGGPLLLLSPQMITSCDSENSGCQGGNYLKAWQYVANTPGGLQSYSSYPFYSSGGVTGECYATPNIGVAQVQTSRFNQVNAGNPASESAMASAL